MRHRRCVPSGIPPVGVIVISVTRRKRPSSPPDGIRPPAGAARTPTCAERPDRLPGGRPYAAVLLPGSGSDAVFVRAAFTGALAAVGVRIVAPDPWPGTGVVDGYRAALDTARAAAGGRPLLVGGVSLGAQVAARWSAGLAPAHRPVGLLLALPAWTGDPAGAPAATAARLSAAGLRVRGAAAELAAVRASVPGWLAAELARAWRGHGAALADSLDAAAAATGPDEADLAALAVPTGIAALRDDPVHPVGVARHWHALLPRSALVETDLTAFGADPAVLGRAAVLAWLRAAAL